MLRLRPGLRRGITLTEILIGIMILGVGLVSLATLFPIGLLRLRDAARWTRSGLLLQSAAADITSRGLINGPSFPYADNLNYQFGLTPWYTTTDGQIYNPLIQDTPSYHGDWYIPQQAPNPPLIVGARASGGPGLPFAYDPLWRYQTLSTATGTPGYYLGDTYEARFGSGIGFLRSDPSGFGGIASAHGLPRLTNFNRPAVMPMANFVPGIFVSQDDLVWQDPNVNTYTINGLSLGTQYASTVTSPSPVIPDLSPPAGAINQNSGGSPSLDWRFSWMFTGQQTSVSNGACFDGNIVIFENRPFGIQAPTLVPGPTGGFQAYQVEGETVVEGVFGYSTNVVPQGGPGYGSAADRTVLLRWNDQLTDPVIHVGDWIADVTYERQQLVVYNPSTGTGRFLNGLPPGAGYPNPTNNGECDNLPAQRCWWYQIQKVGTIAPDPNVAGHRSVTVYVNQSLQSRTVLGGNGQPVYLNAALIAPNVINVIPQTIFLRSSTGALP